MNQVVFNRAMSYIDDDIVERFFDNKNKRESKAKSNNRTHLLLKWGAVAAVFCLVLTTSFVMIFNFFDSSSDPAFALPTSADNILWFDDNTVVHDESNSIVKWNGINVSSSLYEALNKSANDKYLAIIVKYTNDENMNNFVFDNKKYSEHVSDLNLLHILSEKYDTLEKEGELLKFGELLYTEGLSDGTKWTKAYYDERVAYYGSDILAEFIVDGVFLAEKLESSIANNQSKIVEKENTISNLLKAYDENIAPTIISAFDKYLVTSKNGNVYLFITPSELEAIDIDNIADYSMYLASRDGYDNSLESMEKPTDPAIKDNISGFACSKMVFDSLDTQNNKPDSDEAVVRMLNETIEKWRYTYDYIEFTFYYDGTLTEEVFEEMRYVDILQTNYPARMIVKVKYEDINVEAIKDLSQKTEITSIHISAPSDSLVEPEPEVE